MVRRFNQRAVELLREIPARNVLDVGCGDGRLIHQIVCQNHELSVVAIDDDDPKLKPSWQEYGGPRLTFEVADVCKLPYEDNSFQVVTALSVLEHLEDPYAALREIQRVCPRGWLIASVPCEPWWRLGNVVRLRYLRDLGNTPGHIQHWTRRGFRNLLHPHGSCDCFERCTMWSIARLRLKRP
jgi:ubiquinone/menaquinone biosynthesis C-methylase UbiE